MIHPFAFNLSKIASLALLVIVLAGCASTPQFDEQIGLTEQAVANAKNSGALNHAPLPLNLASQKLEQAKQAIREEQYDKAGRLLEEARLDAQVAELRSKSIERQQAAREIQEGINILRNELKRKIR